MAAANSWVLQDRQLVDEGQLMSARLNLVAMQKGGRLGAKVDAVDRDDPLGVRLPDRDLPVGQPLEDRRLGGDPGAR